MKTNNYSVIYTVNLFGLYWSALALRAVRDPYTLESSVSGW